jgi:hypothetical protein
MIRSHEPPVAAIVHAAAALYLGLGSRRLNDLLAVGFSLAELAERRRQSPGGLKRALAAAVRRTSGDEALAAIDRILDATADGATTWEATVDRLVATPRERGWQATAA